MGEESYSNLVNDYVPPSPERPGLVPMETPISLNPKDAFEAALIDIVTMKRRKGKDYDRDQNIFTNFQSTARATGLETEQVILVNVAQKMARLTSLRINGRMKDPDNEATIDSYLDMAVYACILLAYVKAFEVND